MAFWLPTPDLSRIEESFRGPDNAYFGNKHNWRNITSNKHIATPTGLRSTTNSDSPMYFRRLFHPDQFAEATIAMTTLSESHLILRCNEVGNTFYLAGPASNNVILYKYVNGSATSISGVTNPYVSTTARYRFECWSNRLRIFVNGRLLDQKFDNSIKGPGYAGVNMYTGTIRMRDFVAGDLPRRDDSLLWVPSSTFAITSVVPSSIYDDEVGVVITGTGFGVVTGIVKVGGRVQTITNWTDTSITFTAERSTDNLGLATLEVFRL